MTRVVYFVALLESLFNHHHFLVMLLLRFSLPCVMFILELMSTFGRMHPPTLCLYCEKSPLDFTGLTQLAL